MTVSTRMGRLALAFVFALAGAAGAAAQTAGGGIGASDWWRTDEGQVRLVSASGAAGTAEELRFGLQFRLTPGWKVYWRSPGAAGYPPQLDWAGSENLAEASMRWPAPVRFSVIGLDTLGYHDGVIFPITVRPQMPGRALRLRAKLDYLICEEICIPYVTELALDLPAGKAFPTRFRRLIDRYEARVPGDGTAAGLAIERVAVRGRPGAQMLEIAARSTTPFAAPDIFVEGPDMFAFGAPGVRLGATGREALLRLPVETFGDPPAGLAGERLVLTLVDGGRSMEAARAVEAFTPPATADTASLWAILGLALLGGLILNLMPCVLPVLSIKLLGVVELGGGARRTVRAGFLATSAGIVFSFLVLAATAVAVKAAGVSVGWGIQFQQPIFLVAMAAALTLFACNMWDLIRIRLPGMVMDRAAAAGGHGGASGHFLTGALATVMATSCSAPFLGTAVGFALFHGPAEIFAVFTALGVGLALPYLAVAAAPGLAGLLPRPGRWMMVLRRLLGFALAGTVGWLLWVLAAQRGLAAALVVGGLMAAMVLVLWLARTAPVRLRTAGVAGLFALALAVPPLAEAPRAAAPATAALPADDLWQPFDPAAIPALVAAGNTVLVDVTADWCITCQVNKKLVLDAPQVRARLGGAGVVAMLADWTNPDDGIAAYLASFGRYGIPFNAVYGPNAPDGVLLPELLTRQAVLAALDRVGDGTAPAARAVAADEDAN